MKRSIVDFALLLTAPKHPVSVTALPLHHVAGLRRGLPTPLLMTALILTILLGLAPRSEACDWNLPGGSKYIQIPVQSWHASPNSDLIDMRYRIQGSSLTFRSTVEFQVPVIQARVEEISEKRAEELDLEQPGVLVTWVEVGGTADNRGIVKGDIITQLNGEPAVGPDWVANRVRHHDPKVPVLLEVRSGGITREISVPLVLVTKREPRRESHALELIRDRHHTGITFGAMPRDARRLLTGNENEGVVIADVLGGSPGFYSVLRSGDVILSLNGAPVANGTALLDRITQQVAKGSRDLQFTVRRGADTFTETVDAEKHLDRDFRFGIPIVMDWHMTAPRSDFDLGLGLVMDYTRRARVSLEGHSESHEFGMVLNLFHFKSNDDGSRLRLLWLIPISW